MRLLFLWFQSAVFEAEIQGRWFIDLRRIRFIRLFLPEKKSSSGDGKQE